MAKQMLALVDRVLDSSARTARAAVLVHAFGVVAGTVSGVTLPVREPVPAVTTSTSVR